MNLLSKTLEEFQKEFLEKSPKAFLSNFHKNPWQFSVGIAGRVS